MDLTYRIYEPEIMDGDELSGPDFTQALYFLRATNRYFGGNRAILSRLAAYSRRWNPNQTIKILDVGSGLGDIDEAIANWSSKNGFNVKITGLERNAAISEYSRVYLKDYSNVNVQCGDIRSFSIEDGSYDYVIASLLFHHVPDENLGPLLKKLDRMARRGMVISDLLRSRSGYAAVRALSSMIGNAMVRHDGPLSVRKAFRPDELEKLARQNGLPYLIARKEIFFRVSLSGEKI